MIIYTEKTALTRQINVRTKPDGRKYRDDEVEADNINATDILRIGLEICGLFRKFGLLVHKFSLCSCVFRSIPMILICSPFAIPNKFQSSLHLHRSKPSA